MDFATSLPRELETEIARAPIAYLPWGAHEWHGAHNPVGLDGLKAGFLANELCRETGGVVFPTVYCGHTTVANLGFPYSLEFDAETVASLARDYLRELARAGFKIIVIVLGHWGLHHGAIVRREVADFNARQSSTRAWAVQENEILHEPGYPDDHGGAEETSFMMSLLPGKVDLSRLPNNRELSFTTDGILGDDPRTAASADKGAEAVRAYVQKTVERIRTMLEEINA